MRDDASLQARHTKAAGTLASERRRYANHAKDDQAEREARSKITL